MSTLCFQSVENLAGSQVSILSGSKKYDIYFLCLCQLFKKANRKKNNKKLTLTLKHKMEIIICLVAKRRPSPHLELQY